MSYRVVLLLLLSFGAICADALAGFEDRTFDEFRVLTTKRITERLISNNVCRDIIDCQQKKVVFASPAPNGFEVQIYSPRIGVELQKEMTSICQEVFFSNSGMKSISLSVSDEIFSDVINRSIFSRKRELVFKIQFRRR
ncbi:MAG: hypothetical protein IT501_12960 [Rubrivivax sp.]|jgi:hypothetical protein|nr:hypothetical protein [Rubrivivax sp.]